MKHVMNQELEQKFEVFAENYYFADFDVYEEGLLLCVYINN